MPHVSNFMYQGDEIPSVNGITASLSQDGLLRNFYRKLGFKEADKISSEARKAGTKLASIFERYRQTGKTGNISALYKACVKNWLRWYENQSYEITEDCWVEPHLVNTRELYHGSPDVIINQNGNVALGDDKLKKRFADYKLLMNEHAYAMCDSYEDPITKEIKKLPWEPPIPLFWFWTYDPKSGDLFPVQHVFHEEIYSDFLICKSMLGVNKKAEAYFRRFAVLLPSQSE